MAAVAKVVRACLGIDPTLAAAIIKRGPDPLWAAIRDEVIAFARAWHSPGEADRAFAFMMATGRSEFSDLIWPLITDVDHQRQLEALRVAGRFRPEAMKDLLELHYFGLPEATRATLLSEFVYAGGMDGVEGAVNWTLRDSSSEVRIDVVKALIFRGAERYASKLLIDANDKVWAVLGREGYADDIPDGAQADRLRAEQHAAIEGESSWARKLALLLDTPSSESRLKDIRNVLLRPELNMKEDSIGWSFSRLHEEAPDLLASALRERIAQKLGLPWDPVRYRGGIEDQEDNEISAIALGDDPTKEEALSAAMVVGPMTVRVMIDRWLRRRLELQALGRAAPKGKWDRERLEQDQIRATRPAAFANAVLEFVDEQATARIALLSELIGRHGGDATPFPFTLNRQTYDKLVALLIKWGQRLLVAAMATRQDFDKLARAMRRFPDVALLPIVTELLDEDLRRWDEARRAYFAAKRAGPRPVDVGTSYTW
ncbi:hypothetical protein EHS39_36275 [Ensifer sp. MPMI2T]|nr:hypothetical protein EHS39_36275 [Ensifer sp. MPMI2T]